MRTIPNNEHLKFSERGAWVPLFHAIIDSTDYYFTGIQESLFIDGNEYIPLPIQMEELQEVSSGEVPTLKIVCSNIDGAFSTILKESGSIDGETITYKIGALPTPWKPLTEYSLGDKVYADGHIYYCNSGGQSDSVEPTWNTTAGSITYDNLGALQITWVENISNTDNVIYEETVEILKVSNVTMETITLEVGTFNPYLIKYLQEKYLKNFCWNSYKGDGCWVLQPDGTYDAPTGFTDNGSCNKTLEDCLNNTNTTRFNSFPTLGVTGGRFA